MFFHWDGVVFFWVWLCVSFCLVDSCVSFVGTRQKKTWGEAEREMERGRKRLRETEMEIERGNEDACEAWICCEVVCDMF